MSKAGIIILIVVVAVVALYFGFLYGDKKGYNRGYDQGLTDAAKIEAGGADTGVKVDTGYKNPYEGLNFNPFKQ